MYMKINIKKSNMLSRFITGVHTGALLIAISLPAALGIQIGLATMIVASSWWQRRCTGLAAPAELELRADGICSICRQCAPQKFGGHLVGAAIHPGFIRLTVKAHGRRSRVLLVMRDAVEVDVYRELRAGIVQGRWSPRAQAAA